MEKQYDNEKPRILAKTQTSQKVVGPSKPAT